MFSDALSASVDCCTSSSLTPYRIVPALWSSLGSLKGARALKLPLSRRVSTTRRDSWTWTPMISSTSATILACEFILCMLLKAIETWIFVWSQCSLLSSQVVPLHLLQVTGSPHTCHKHSWVKHLMDLFHVSNLLKSWKMIYKREKVYLCKSFHYKQIKKTKTTSPGIMFIRT